jgi:hypothetical protein
LGGVCAVISGLLYLAKAVLEWRIGDPPAAAADLARWVSDNYLSLALLDEALVFLAVFLIPVVLALFRSLDGPSRPWVAFGCGIIAVSIPVLLVIAMALGRLVYPVYGLPATDPAPLLVFTLLYYGGAHEVTLLLAAALVMLGLAMGRSAHARWVGALGVVAGGAQVAASYPWLIGAGPTLLCQALLATWLLLVGATLLRAPSIRPSRGRPVLAP